MSSERNAGFHQPVETHFAVKLKVYTMLSLYTYCSNVGPTFECQRAVASAHYSGLGRVRWLGLRAILDSPARGAGFPSAASPILESQVAAAAAAAVECDSDPVEAARAEKNAR